jgi:hypothetical protein
MDHSCRPAGFVVMRALALGKPGLAMEEIDYEET